MRNAIVGTLLLFSAPAMAATVFIPVHIAPAIHVAPAVRVNPGVHVHSTIKPTAKGSRRHSRHLTVVTDTPATQKCADQKSDKECRKK